MWTRISSVSGNTNFASTQVDVFTGSGWLTGDLVVAGAVTTAGTGLFTMTDFSAVPNNWVLLQSSGSVVGGLLSLLWATIADADSPSAFLEMATDGVRTGYWFMAVAVYRGGGPVLVDSGSGTDGNGSVVTAGPVPPASNARLAVLLAGAGSGVFSFTPHAGFAIAQQQTAENHVNGCYCDLYPAPSAIAPSVTMDAAIPWVATTQLWQSASPLRHGHPGPFLGGGIEPFPMRRKPERRYEDLLHYRRDRLARNFIK